MTLHVFENIEQRTPEWYAARCGIVTASVVGKLVTYEAPSPVTVDCPKCKASAGSPCMSLARKQPTPVKTYHPERGAVTAEMPAELVVANNDTARSVTAGLVAERILGRAEESPMTPDMWRGVEHEPYARDIYSGLYQQAVECGFMRLDRDGWRLGYSPDGLVADDGLVEIKCPRAKGHVSTILADAVPATYMAQCQTALLVSGRKWLDYVSFCAGLPLFVKRVHPDPAWHQAITAAVAKFETTAAEMTAAFAEAAQDMPATERLDLEIVI